MPIPKRSRKRRWATLTAKREIENVLHPHAIQGALVVTVTFGDDDDVLMIVAQAVHEGSKSSREWDVVDDRDPSKKASGAKRRLWMEATGHMTSQRPVECDPDGEVSRRLTQIAAAGK